ncbi:MAG: DUF2232 domain-containing protein [bacterium]
MYIMPITSMFTAVPIAFFTLRTGRKPALLLVATTFVFFCLILNLPNALLFLVVFGFLGLALAEGVGRQFTSQRVIALGFLSLMVISLVSFELIKLNTTYINSLKSYLTTNIQDAVNKVKEKVKVKEKNTTDKHVQIDLDNYLITFKNYLKNSLWGIGLSYIFLLVVLNYYVTAFFLRKYGYPYLNYVPQTSWVLPDYFIWGFIVAAIMWLLKSISPVRLIGQNLLIFFFALYLSQGIAIFRFYYRKFKLSKPLKFLLSVIIFIQPVLFVSLSFSMAGLGFFDTWFDLRKIRRKDS